MYGMRYAVLRVNIGFFESGSVWSDSLRPHELYSPWNSSGQNSGVDSLSYLQGIFPTQGLNLGLLHLQVDSLPCEPPGKPNFLLWLSIKTLLCYIYYSSAAFGEIFSILKTQQYQRLLQLYSTYYLI